MRSLSFPPSLLSLSLTLKQCSRARARTRTHVSINTHADGRQLPSAPSGAGAQRQHSAPCVCVCASRVCVCACILIWPCFARTCRRRRRTFNKQTHRAMLVSVCCYRQCAHSAMCGQRERNGACCTGSARRLGGGRENRGNIPLTKSIVLARKNYTY